MTLVDNKKGFSSHITNGGNEYNMDIIDIQFNDIKIYGEYGSPDCPQNGQGGFCTRGVKTGYVSAVGTYGGKPLHITGASKLPPEKIKSIASWGTKVQLNRISFINFKALTAEGS